MTQSQQIWEWVKAHPDHKAQDCAKGLGILESSATSQLCDMRNRGMVRRVKRSYFNDNARKITSYCYTAVGSVYKYLPLPEGHQPLHRHPPKVKPAQASLDLPLPNAPAPAQIAPPVAPIPTPEPAPAPTEAKPPEGIEAAISLVKTMDLLFAKDVYRVLKHLFTDN